MPWQPAASPGREVLTWCSRFVTPNQWMQSSSELQRLVFLPSFLFSGLPHVLSLETCYVDVFICACVHTQRTQHFWKIKTSSFYKDWILWKKKIGRFLSGTFALLNSTFPEHQDVELSCPRNGAPKDQPVIPPTGAQDRKGQKAAAAGWSCSKTVFCFFS